MKNIKAILEKKTTKTILPVILLALGITLILLSQYFETDNKEQTGAYSNAYETEYTEILENKLKSVLESITGKDTVNVMITLESTFEENIYDEVYESSKFSYSGTTKSKENFAQATPTPKIGGVMIVCGSLSNAKDINTIKKAAATALNINENKIYIIGGVSKK